VLSRRARAAIAIAAAAALAAGAGDGLAGDKKKTRRKGKVVRVERTKVDPGMVRMCGSPRPDGGATCWGQPPEVGEVGAILDDSGMRGTSRVTKVVPTLDTCGNTISYDIQGEVRGGDLSQLNTSVGAMVFDWKTGSRSRALNIYGSPPVVAPGLHGAEFVLGALDDDGDSRPDLVLIWFYCDATGQSTRSGSGHYCLVHYRHDGTAYAELRLDVVRNC